MKIGRIGQHHSEHDAQSSAGAPRMQVHKGIAEALEQALGSEFTPAMRDAWVVYYQALAGEMKAAAPAPQGIYVGNSEHQQIP